MASVNELTGTASIGELAGKLWQYLRNSGPVPMAQLVKDLDEPRDLVMQAIGWLAREDKLVIEGGSRRKLVSLR